MNRFLLAVVSVGLLGIGLTPSVRADAWNPAPIAKTWTLSVAVLELPKPPGPYLIGLAALYSLGIFAVLRAIQNSRRW